MKQRVGSRAIYVPSAVSSFFEICDRSDDGTTIEDPLRVGSRGGGFVIKKGSITKAFRSQNGSDTVSINGARTPQARTTLKLIELMRSRFAFDSVRVFHRVEPPIGLGFGTSGSGTLGAAIAIADLFDLKLTLAQVSDFAHIAEVQSVTGLGTVISLASGCGAGGLVIEPGSYSVGRVDSLIFDHNGYAIVCACFGPIEKSSILKKESFREMVNESGRTALETILSNPTPETLLRQSRLFAERSGIGSVELLKLSDMAVKMGALGATQNMIGNAIHALVKKKEAKRFVTRFQKHVESGRIFVSDLIHSGPVIL